MSLQVDTTQFLKIRRIYFPSKNGIILINYIHLKFRSANKSITKIIKIKLKSICKVLLRHLWQSLVLWKLHAFRIFFRTVSSKKIIFWEASFSGHSTKSLIANTFDGYPLIMKATKGRKKCFQLFFLVGRAIWFCVLAFCVPNRTCK